MIPVCVGITSTEGVGGGGWGQEGRVTCFPGLLYKFSCYIRWFKTGSNGGPSGLGNLVPGPDSLECWERPAAELSVVDLLKACPFLRLPMKLQFVLLQVSPIN